ncbi:hypothetical protein RUM44_003098 [Polyplax serrata]|uniref:Uncharacterized protein n=1 Tax=Polyplax serrata TaxID=468196 RepID=A0ABR1AXJ1_POLSC
MQKLTKQGQSFRQTYRSLKLPTGAILVVLSLNQYELYVSRVRVSSDLDRQNKITQEILAKYLQRRLFSHLLNTRAQSVPVGHSRQQRARAHTRADFYQDDALETVESERIPNFQLLEDDLQEEEKKWGKGGRILYLTTGTEDQNLVTCGVRHLYKTWLWVLSHMFSTWYLLPPLWMQALAFEYSSSKALLVHHTLFKARKTSNSLNLNVWAVALGNQNQVRRQRVRGALRSALRWHFWD